MERTSRSGAEKPRRRSALTPTEQFTSALWDALQELTKGEVREPILHVCRGYWTHAHQDVMAWQGYVNINGRDFQIGSWNSVTECARRGFSISDERRNDRREVDYQIFANPRKPRRAANG